jgi:hypothetical protein
MTNNTTSLTSREYSDYKTAVNTKEAAGNKRTPLTVYVQRHVRQRV